MGSRFRIFVCSTVLLVAGCSIGPRYKVPTAPVPPAYKETGVLQKDTNWKPAQPADAASRGKWWEGYGDQQLNKLEEQLNISNQNIAAAVANIQAARAMIREARAQYFPTVGVNPSITNNRASTAYGRSLGTTFGNYSLPLETSWEPDLWSRVRNTVKTNTFAAQARAADLENVRLSAQAELATDYYELREQDDLKKLLDSTVRSYEEDFKLTLDLYRSGLGNDEAVGTAIVAGFNIVSQSKEVRRRIGYVSQMLSADGELTGYENLLISAKLYGLSRADRSERIAQALAFMQLEEAAHRLVKHYSGGMVRRLEIAQSMLHRPRILFLDEPTVGLDPTAKHSVWQRILDLRQQFGTSVLMTTHDMEEADRLCGTIAFMHQGRLLASGSPSDLKSTVGPAASLDDVFIHYSGTSIGEGGNLRDVARTRRTVRRLE